MKLSRLLSGLALAACLANGAELVPYVWDRLVYADMKRDARFDSLVQSLETMPDGGRRDSLIAKIFHIRACDTLSRYCEATFGKGRMDSLKFRSSNEEYRFWWIPKQLGMLTGLKYLALQGDTEPEIPSQLGRLENLSYLSLAGLKPSAIPSELGNLSRLQALDLSDNNLKSIPAFVYKLRNLRSLDLSGNRLSAIPGDIAKLRSLSRLSLERNLLKSIHPGIAGLRHLDTVKLKGNLLAREDLDTAVATWLDGKGFDWKPGIKAKDLDWFVRELGRRLIGRPPAFQYEERDIAFDYNRSESEAFDLVKYPVKTIEEMVPKADSLAVSAAIERIARNGSDRYAPRELIRGLLTARSVCERHPAILRSIKSELGRFAKKISEPHAGPPDEVLEFEAPYPEYFLGMNRRLFDFESYYRVFLLYWGLRERDGSSHALAELLKRVRDYRFPGLTLDSVSFADAPRPKTLKTFYFSDRTFGDTAQADTKPGFEYKERMALHYFEEVYPRNCGDRREEFLFKWRVIKDSLLWRHVLDLRSPFFDSGLAYWAAYEDSAGAYRWKETELDPRLVWQWSNCEGYDGASFDLRLHLFLKDRDGRRPRVFVGIPRDSSGGSPRRPNGFFSSKQAGKTVKADSVDNGGYIENRKTLPQACRWETRKYTTPGECPNLKSLFVKDLYLTDRWEHMMNFSPRTLRYAFDTLPLARSTLYAIYASGDTAALNVDSAYGNDWSDGGGEILGAYTFSPRFADLDGDGRFELFVETRKGTIFFNQDEAGAFVRAEGR